MYGNNNININNECYIKLLRFNKIGVLKQIMNKKLIARIISTILY